MNRHYLFPLSAPLVLALAITASAQRPAASPAPAQPKPTPVPTAPATVALPMSKMALIYTDLFLDPKTGIGKFNNALNKLNGEFQTVKNEITAMQQRAQALEDEINKLRSAPEGTPIDQRSLQTKIDQLEQLKKDVQRKAEDAQAAYNRRRQEIFLPVQEEVGRALEVFAKARGINVILDGTQVPVLYATEAMDITKAFIADFNSKNPVTAVSATPPPK